MGMMRNGSTSMLSKDGSKSNLQVHFDQIKKQVHIPMATEIRVTTKEQLMTYMERGVKVRRTSATRSN